MPDADFICPNCGAEVPARAKACPECGSDENTGWSDQTIYDGTGIEDPAAFDHQDWERRELGGAPRKSGVSLMWWFGAIVLFVALLWMFVLRRIMDAL